MSDGGRLPLPLPRKHSARGRISQMTAFALNRMVDMGYDPIESMILLAQGKAVCSYCKGEGCHAVGRLHDPEICDGQGNERVPIEIRAKMVIESAQYVYPKRKAVEVVVDDDDQDNNRKTDLVNNIMQVLDGTAEDVTDLDK